MAADPRLLSRFIDWLKGNGARFDRIAISDEPPGPRGVLTSAALAPGDLVLSVPRRLVLSLEQARESAMGRAIADAGVEYTNAQSYMAAFLLQERRAPDSFFAPYLDILPTAFPSLPLLYTDGELSYLRGSLLVDLIEARRQALTDEDALLREHVPAFAAFSQAEFVWARSLVTSRIFGVALDEGETECLVPLADLLNHRAPRQTRWGYEKERREFVITALEAVPAGAAVHDSYGTKCNSRFLLNYGYTLDDNDENECRLRLRMPRTHGSDLKRRLLGLEHGAIARSFQISARYEGPALEMFSFLRVALSDATELAGVTRTSGIAPGPGRSGPMVKCTNVPPLSISNEERVLLALAAACEESLARFDTTLAEDERLLAAPCPALSENVRNCIVMRRGEKQILHHHLDLVRAALPRLREPLAALEHKAAHPDAAWIRFDGYFEKALLPCVRAAVDCAPNRTAGGSAAR